MIRNLCKITVLFAAAALALSCGDSRTGDTDDPNQYGTLDLASVSVSSVETTRSVDTDEFILRIWDDRNALSGEWVLSELPDDAKLKVGSYTLEVCSPELLPAGWETPWYTGSAQFAIAANERTGIGAVTCRQGNIKVTVRYSSSLLGLLGEDINTTVSIDGNSLSYGRTEELPHYIEMRSGYFSATAQTDMTVSFEGTVDGTHESFSEVISGVKPGEWEKIRFTFEETPGGRTFHMIVFDSEPGGIEDGDDWGEF